MFKKFAFMAAAVVALSLSTAAFAQTTPTGGTVQPPKNERKADEKADSDKPIAPSRIDIPMPDGTGPTPGEQDIEDENEKDGPPEEIEDVPPDEVEDPPEFFGEPIEGRFVWILDRSGSMGAADSGSGPIEDANGNIFTNPNRIQIVKSECIKVLSQLTTEHWFAIVTFGMSPDVDWYQQLVNASSGAVSQGIQFVSSMVANGGTPAYPALKRACEQYPSEPKINKFYFLCDGQPNVGGGSAQILSDFPMWYQVHRDAGSELVCVHIGTSGSAATFMQALANGNGGTYIHK
jgi:hypothetical protein